MPGIKQYSRRNIFGLDEILNAKIAKDAIQSTLDDVVNSNSATTIPSTAAVVELKTNLEQRIQDTKNFAQDLIDDTVEGGTDKTWSVDKIKQFVASVDDTVVVQNIADRDALNAYDSLIAYVLDTSDDNSLSDDVKGKPFAYIYANGQWQPISPLAGEIDSSSFVRYNDIVNDLTTGGANKPLSAEMGKYIANQLIPQAQQNATQTLVTEQLEIQDNKLVTAKTILGNIVFNSVEVSTDEGIVVIDAEVTGTKEVTVYPGDGNDFNGKVARVTYLANLNESTTDDSGDGEIASSSGSASGSASGSSSSSSNA